MARKADKRASAVKNLKKRSGVAATTTIWITTTITTTSSTKHRWSAGRPSPAATVPRAAGTGEGAPDTDPRADPPRSRQQTQGGRRPPGPGGAAAWVGGGGRGRPALHLDH